MKRVLFFSPYSKWHYHGVQEATIAHALNLRGATTGFVLCNGLFPACDAFRRDINPRTALSCNECQAEATALFHEMKLPYDWLGNYVTMQKRREVAEWIKTIPAEELLSASWRGRPVGYWARSSAFYQFRMSHFETDDPDVQQGLREFVHGTALALEAVEELYNEWAPDVVVMLNGRFFSHWAAVEIAQQRGIRIVTHERGMIRGTLRFGENTRIHDIGIFKKMWDQWKSVPLSHEEILFTHEVLQNRRMGKGMPWMAYSPSPQDQTLVRRELGIGSRPIIAVFSGSEDESAAFEDRRVGAFPNMLDWMPATVDLATRIPDHTIVIRLHPNLTAYGVNRQTLEFMRNIGKHLPDNCIIVQPDAPISSYTLADISALGVVYFSTLGLEMACRGQPVVVTARGWYGHCEFVNYLQAPEQYEAVVREALRRGRQTETARLAYRFAYHYYHDVSLPFPLVVEEPRHHGRIKFSRIGELSPGRHLEIDRICGLILNGESLLPSPEATHTSRDTNAEVDFLRAALTL